VIVNQDGIINPAGDFRRTTSVTNTGTNCISVTVQVWYSVRPEVLCTLPVTVQTMIHTTMQL
jgi:hypothetical protein